MKKKQVILVLLAVAAVAGFAACDNPWWPQKDMGTLTYDANGGIGTVPTAQTADFRTPIIIASPGGLTKPDHNFHGWNTKKTGDGVNYDTGAALTLSGDITLYANWVQIDPDNPDNSTPGYYYPGGGGGFYYPGGGGGDAGPPYTVTYINGPIITGIYPNVLHTVLPGPEDMDKVFMGWKAQQGSPLLAVGDEIQVTANMTLAPVWAAKARGLAVQTEKNDGSLTASGAAFYGSYVPTAEGVKQDITIKNISGKKVGPFYISYIERSYKIEKAAFGFYYFIDGDEKNPQNLSSMRARATVSLGAKITEELDVNDAVTFRIRPVDKFIPVGTHSLEVSIADDEGNGATFAMSFTVNPIPLIITTGNVAYTNSGGALTPIEATIENKLYTERTASFDVSVGGFIEGDDADDIGLTLVEIINTGLSAKIEKMDGFGLSNSGKGNGTTLDDGDGKYTKTWKVTVTLDDSNTAKTFSDGMALVCIGLEGFDKNFNYYNEYSTSTEFPLAVHDGRAQTEKSVIPVTPGNVLAFNFYAGTPNGLKRHYKQTEDITLPAPAAGGSNWTAIGNFYQAGGYPNSIYAFSGSYNGANKLITGLTIIDGITHQGMFSIIDSTGVVKNLNLVDIDITCESYAGGLVYMNYGKLINCSVTGRVFTTSGSATSGVVGHNAGTVEDCVSSAEVTSGNMYVGDVGGVVGYNDNGTVENCYATGDVNGYVNVGGVVGNNNGTVEYCYYTTGNVTGISSVGGIVGNNAYGEVRYCYVTGATITGAGSTAGGVIGGNSSGTVEQCYVANTDVTVKTTNSYTNQGRYAGGVVGWNSGEVRNCYITGRTVTGGTYTGGVVGRNNNGGNTQYCYSTCVVIGSGVYSTAADFLGGVVGANHNGSIAQNNVALNPSVTGSGLKYVGRVVGKNSTYNNLERGTVPTKNYAWSGMTTTNDGTIKANDVIDGDPITASDWNSASWWTTGSNWAGGAWDINVWDIADNTLPTLKGMPGTLAQNPEVVAP